MNSTPSYSLNRGALIGLILLASPLVMGETRQDSNTPDNKAPVKTKTADNDSPECHAGNRGYRQLTDKFNEGI